MAHTLTLSHSLVVVSQLEHARAGNMILFGLYGIENIGHVLREGGDAIEGTESRLEVGSAEVSEGTAVRFVRARGIASYDGTTATG